MYLPEMMLSMWSESSSNCPSTIPELTKTLKISVGHVSVALLSTNRLLSHVGQWLCTFEYSISIGKHCGVTKTSKVIFSVVQFFNMFVASSVKAYFSIVPVLIGALLMNIVPLDLSMQKKGEVSSGSHSNDLASFLNDKVLFKATLIRFSLALVDFKLPIRLALREEIKLKQNYHT